ncbi:unnamed protein product, partial [Ectocarpus sp. 13 AM-2016]
MGWKQTAAAGSSIVAMVLARRAASFVRAPTPTAGMRRAIAIRAGGASVKPRWEGGPGSVFQASGWGTKDRRRCLSMVAVGDVAGVEYSLRTED